MKVVINKCFGGFGLSYKAVMRYAELSGFKLYAYTHIFPKNPKDEVVYEPYDGKKDVWMITYSKRSGIVTANEMRNDDYYLESQIERTDPILIQVIEELGKEANGRYASLSIIEIPDDIEWEIEEYDGTEHIAEKHRTWE